MSLYLMGCTGAIEVPTIFDSLIAATVFTCCSEAVNLIENFVNASLCYP